MTESKRGEETRDRIIEAALETVREVGFAHTTARAVAERGDFNPALIFYHFGSVDDLLQQAFGRVSDQQVERYGEAMKGVTSLPDLVAIARRLHDDDMETGAVTAATQLMAAATDPERATVLLDRFDAWIRLVQDGLERASGDVPIAALLPPREVAYSIAALFLGIELMSRLDPERSEATQVFDMLEGVAQLAEQFAPILAQVVGELAAGTAPPPAPD